MSGIFLSHSSKDKPFVTKLAIDLVNRGFPVWFDSWEIDEGDGLFNKVYDGIDESTLVLLLLSPNSVASDWVNRELNAALAKEVSLNRKFLIPIVAEKCTIPLKIADRIYSDFSGQYLTALEKLTKLLEKQSANKIQIEPLKQIIPFSFVRDVHLDRSALQLRLTHLNASGRQGIKIIKEQVVIAPNPTYLSLREKAAHRMENIATDPFFTPDFHKSFSFHYNSIVEWDRKIIEGLVLILNRTWPQVDMVEACYWYARERLAYLFLNLWNVQSPDDPNAISKTDEWEDWLGHNLHARRFYSVESLKHFDVFRKDYSESVSIWADEDSSVGRYFQSIAPVIVQEPLKSYDGGDFYSKYVVPQLLLRHQQGTATLITDIDNLMIGPS